MKTLIYIIRILNNKYQVDFDEMEELLKLFNETNLTKGDFYVKEGKVCDFFGILNKGLMMAEFTDEKGKTHVTKFYTPPPPGIPIVTNFESFIKRTQSNESIIALEDCTLLTINEKVFREKLLLFPNIHMMLFDVMEAMYIVSEKRNADLQTLSNIKRIKLFIKEHGDLFNKVKKEYVASYLNISRNQFTRLLKQLNKHD